MNFTTRILLFLLSTSLWMAVISYGAPRQIYCPYPGYIRFPNAEELEIATYREQRTDEFIDKGLENLFDEEGIDPATHDFSGGNRLFDLDEYYKIIAPKPESRWSEFWKGIKNWFRKVGQAIAGLFNPEYSESSDTTSSDDSSGWYTSRGEPLW